MDFISIYIYQDASQNQLKKFKKEEETDKIENKQLNTLKPILKGKYDKSKQRNSRSIIQKKEEEAKAEAEAEANYSIIVFLINLGNKVEYPKMG